MKVFCLATLSIAFLSGCAGFQRSSGSGYASDPYQSSGDSSSHSTKDRATQRVAYELGKDPNSLTPDDLAQVQSRQKLRDLERTLHSPKEKEQYSKILPWFRDDDEKVEFLTIPSIEGRQQWVNRKGIWERSKAPQADMKNLIETQDIAVGMPQEYVKKSWGDPAKVEVSGNPIYRNERWKYQRQVASPEGFRKETRYVYFEGGRVVGWETE